MSEEDVCAVRPVGGPARAIGARLRVVCGRLTQLTIVIGVATLGGWGAHVAGVPLGWLLGALAASTLTALLGCRASVEPVRPYVLILLGLALGQSFTKEVVWSVLGSLPAIVLCAMATVVAGLFGASVYRRHAGLDPRTAFFCGTPGGVVLMAIHAREAGLPEQQVVLAQTIRLMLVVLLYPTLVARVAMPGESGAVGAVLVHGTSLPLLLLWWLAGLGAAVLGRQAGIPNPWMLAPCLLAAGFAATGNVPAHVPDVAVVVAQVVLGISLGARMTPEFLQGAGRLVSASLLSAALLSMLLIPLSFGAAWLFGLPVAAVLLGMAPGGMPEMVITAHALQVSVPLVLAFHFVRVIVSNLLIEPIWRCARALRLA